MERCYIAIFRALPIINSKVELAGGHKMEIHALGAGHMRPMPWPAATCT